MAERNWDGEELMTEPMRLKPFLRAFRLLIFLFAVPFVGAPIYLILTGDQSLNGWLGVGYGALASTGIATISALLLVRGWRSIYYLTICFSVFFIGAQIGNGYAAFSAGIVAIISIFIYQGLNQSRAEK